MSEERDQAVAAHYAAYPYPARDPADEAARLIEGSPRRLPEIAHTLFAGRLPDPFRALVAGGGTGDAAIMLAQHMASAGAAGEVVYLDLSPAARKVAEARAAARGLSNIRFLEGSLLEARAHAGGDFDYVDCCGVLHHLEAPGEGLAALVNVLKSEGGLGVMVYGAVGRRGVYDMQDLAAAFAPEPAPPGERLQTGRRLFKALPQTNWLKRNSFVRDHLDGGDAGFYDLLLHARDRAYTAGELIDLAESAGLAVVRFLEPALYEPATYLKDATLARAADAMPWREHAALAELIAGNLTKHVVYLTPAGRAATAEARPDDGAAIPILRDANGPVLAAAARRSLTLNAKHMGADIPLVLPEGAPAILAAIDGARPLAAIYTAAAQAEPALDWPRFQSRFAALYATLRGLNLIWLKR